MKIHRTFTLLSAALGLALLSSTAHAAIVVVDSASAMKTPFYGTNSTATFTSTDLGGFDPSGTAKLVVTIGLQHTATVNQTTSVTYGGVAMTQAVIAGSGGGGWEAAIFYLDNPTSLGDLVLSFDSSRGASVTVYSLNGTAAGHGSSNGSTSSASTTLTTTAANSFVLAAATVSGTTIPVAQSPLTGGEAITNPYNGSAQTSISTGYQTVASAGSITPTFDIGNTTVAAEFTVIPEPSTALLGSLGMLALLRRRR